MLRYNDHTELVVSTPTTSFLRTEQGVSVLLQPCISTQHQLAAAPFMSLQLAAQVYYTLLSVISNAFGIRIASK
jgi:hypothetical protein